ncbi:hypothetical protein DFH09DRAFT_976946 [Mycena vulgaris]|nr:hypothetical protein DFH09DRAFT_976946 [Mycena vulgaris]
MHEFKHGSAAAQLSAARLWAILLRNSSAAFITQSTAVDFLESVEAIITSKRTSHVLRQRVLRVLGDAVFSNPTHEAFRTLWLAVRPDDQPSQGSSYNAQDALLGPPSRLYRPNTPGILDRVSPPVLQPPRIDSRFPYEWETPPPSYESTFSTAAQCDSDSQRYGSVESGRDGDNDGWDNWDGDHQSPLIVVSRAPRPVSPFQTTRDLSSPAFEPMSVDLASPARPFARHDRGGSGFMVTNSTIQATSRLTPVRRFKSNKYNGTHCIILPSTCYRAHTIQACSTQEWNLSAHISLSQGCSFRL